MTKRMTKLVKSLFVVSLFLTQIQAAAITVKGEYNKVQLKATTGTAELVPYLGNKESRIEDEEKLPDLVEATEEPTTEPTGEPTSPPTPEPTEAAPEETGEPLPWEVEEIPEINENHDFVFIEPLENLSQEENEVIDKRTVTTKTFQTSNNEFETVLYFEPIHKEVEGTLIDIDMDLKGSPTTFSWMEETGLVYNDQGYYEIYFYENEERVTTIKNESGYELSTKIPYGNTSEIGVEGNTIHYQNVMEGIDYLYYLSSTKVKENILLTKPREVGFVSERLEIGTLEPKLIENRIELSHEGEVEFQLLAPYLMDNQGEISEEVTVGFDRISETEIEVFYTYNQDWVNAEERVYPIAIDPIIAPRSSASADVTTSFTRSWGGLPMQWPDLYVGSTRATSDGEEMQGIGRGVVHFVMPAIGAEMEVVSSTLSLYRCQNRSSDTGLDVYTTPSYVDPARTSHQAVLSGAKKISSVSSGELASLGYKNFDITTHTKEVYAGTNKTIVLVAQNENYGPQPHIFWTEGGAERPKVSISYRLAYDVDPATDIEKMDARLRLFSKGIGQFDSMSIDGIAKPNSSIEFELYKINEEGEKVSTGEKTEALLDLKGGLFFVDPIYIKSPKSDVQVLEKEKVNYTTDYISKDVLVEKETFYTFKMKVSQGGLTNTKETWTDKVMIHEVKLGENIASLASYYGNTIEQIKIDNKMEDSFIKEGDELLLRVPSDSPKVNENEVVPPLMFSEYTAEYKYRGPVCLYGCYAGDPINTSSGNYYHENTDFILRDYQDIAFKRYYNSLGEVITTEFGNGFSSNYHQFVFADKEENMYFFMGDGKVYQFRKNGNGYEKELDNPYDIEVINHRATLTEEKTKQTHVFNEEGLLEKIVELNGHFTEVLYNEYGQLTGLNIDDQKEVLFTYNQANLIEKISLPDGTETQYQYNEKNQLIAFTNTEGYTETYTYDDQGRISEIVDEEGFSLGRNTYDEQNRVLTQMDGEGKTMVFEYGEFQTAITDDEGRTVIYGYDEDKRITELVYEDGTKQINTYSEDENELLSITNEKGEVSTYETNEFGYISKQVDFDGSITLYETDKNGNVTHQVNPNGTEEFKTFDGYGNLLSHTDIYGKTTRYTVDHEKRRTSKTDARGNTESYTYEGNQLKTLTNTAGLVTTYTYDDLGYVIQEEDQLGRVTKREVDSRGNCTKEIDSFGAVERYEYDGNDNVIKTIDALGAVTEMDRLQ